MTAGDLASQPPERCTDIWRSLCIGWGHLCEYGLKLGAFSGKKFQGVSGWNGKLSRHLAVRIGSGQGKPCNERIRIWNRSERKSSPLRLRVKGNTHSVSTRSLTMKTQPAITHNQVEEAMRQFLKKGGKIEVLFPDLSQELLLKRELKENWDDQLVVPASTESFAISVVDKTVANVAG
tara:strand:+ start:390 stop:923 length:534 start_codon:yes stop_codon:yes gene_type:complete